MNMIKRVISDLKRHFPLPVGVYKITSREQNEVTGEETTTRDFKRVIAILMPPTLAFQIARSLPAVRQQVTGSFETEGTQILIDGSDLPKVFTFEPLTDYYLVAKSSRYEVSRSQEYGLRDAFILTVKATVGMPLEQIIDRNINDDLYFAEGVSRE